MLTGHALSAEQKAGGAARSRRALLNARAVEKRGPDRTPHRVRRARTAGFSIRIALVSAIKRRQRSIGRRPVSNRSP